MKRRLAVLGLITSGVAPVIMLALAQPSAAGQVFGGYSVTAVVRGSATDGNIGASGGLTPLDSGSASVDAAIDNSPSASVLARPVEPGTTYTTVGSQLPADPGYPKAQASYPGGHKTSSVDPTGFSAASAEATAHSAFGEARSNAASQDPFSEGTSSAKADLSASPAGITASGSASVASFTIAGVLDVEHVQGHASITASPSGKPSVSAGLTTGSITVAGQAVTVDANGVHAQGAPDSPLTPQQLTDQVDAVLSQAGVTISLGTVVEQTGKDGSGHHATADSGGLVISVTTPDPSGGAVPGNTVTFILGRVLLLESDSPPSSAPVADHSWSAQPPAPAAQPPVFDTPVSPPITAIDAQVPSTVGPPTANPVSGQPAQLQLMGKTISKPAAIGVVGAWMIMSMSMALFAAVATRPTGEELLP